MTIAELLTEYKEEEKIVITFMDEDSPLVEGRGETIELTKPELILKFIEIYKRASKLQSGGSTIATVNAGTSKSSPTRNFIITVPTKEDIDKIKQNAIEGKSKKYHMSADEIEQFVNDGKIPDNIKTVPNKLNVPLKVVDGSKKEWKTIDLSKLTEIKLKNVTYTLKSDEKELTLGKYILNISNIEASLHKSIDKLAKKFKVDFRPKTFKELKSYYKQKLGNPLSNVNKQIEKFISQIKSGEIQDPKKSKIVLSLEDASNKKQYIYKVTIPLIKALGIFGVSSLKKNDIPEEIKKDFPTLKAQKAAWGEMIESIKQDITDIIITEFNKNGQKATVSIGRDYINVSIEVPIKED